MRMITIVAWAASLSAKRTSGFTSHTLPGRAALRRRDRRRGPQRPRRRHPARPCRALRAVARAPRPRGRRRRVRAPVAGRRRTAVALRLPRLSVPRAAGRRARAGPPAAPARDLVLHPAPGRQRAARAYGRGAARELARLLRDDLAGRTAGLPLAHAAAAVGRRAAPRGLRGRRLGGAGRAA